MKNIYNFYASEFLLYFISSLSWLMLFMMFGYVYIIVETDYDKRFVSEVFVVFELLSSVGLVLLIRFVFYKHNVCMLRKINNIVGTSNFSFNGVAKENNYSQDLYGFNEAVDRIEYMLKEHINNENSLRESDAYNKILFEGSRLALVVLDPKTQKFTDCNSAALAIYGFDNKESFLGLTPANLAPKFQYDGIDSNAAASRYIEGALNHGAQRFEWLQKKPNGEVWDAKVHLMAFLYRGEVLLQFSVEDITERKKIDRAFKTYQDDLEKLVAERTKELHAAKEAAEVANKIKTLFLGNISHEIRTPVTTIVGVGRILQRGNYDDRFLELISVILKSSGNLIKVLDDIILMSRIESGDFIINKSDFSTKKLLVNVVNKTKKDAYENGLSLSFEIDDCFPMFSGDEENITRALLNYVRNAIKFTASGSVKIRSMVVSETEINALVRFEVDDTGIGVNSNDMARLFQLFEQLDGSLTRRYSGTGLGLVITKRLAQMMGGDAGCISTPGVGSQFWFTVLLEKISAH